MRIDLEELKELSNLVREDCSIDLNEYIFLCKVNVVKDKPPVEVDRSWARFVKAANPQTILALIELIEVYQEFLIKIEKTTDLTDANFPLKDGEVEGRLMCCALLSMDVIEQRKRILGA